MGTHRADEKETLGNVTDFVKIQDSDQKLKPGGRYCENKFILLQ